MKNKLLLLFICLFSFVLTPVCAKTDGYYKVLKVVDGDTMYVDFNADEEIQKNEKVRINGIDAFEVRKSEEIGRAHV